MQKKYIINNIIVVLISLFAFLLTTVFFVFSKMEETKEVEVKRYLDIAREVFNGTNFEDTQKTIAKDGIRLTIINLDGRVIIDSEYFDEMESHIDREEINDLGKVYTRVSKTTNERYMYICALDDGHFVRIAIKSQELDYLLISHLTVGLIAFAVITIISIIISRIIANKVLSPFNIALSNLSRISNIDSPVKMASIDDFKREIQNISLRMESYIEEVKYEKEKINEILATLNALIVVLDSESKIVLANNKFNKLYNVKENVEGTTLNQIVRDINIQELTNKNGASIEVEKNGCFYKVDVHEIRVRYSVYKVISYFDITELRRVSLVKKDFFQNASHELKSPLTTIIGYLQLIEQKVLDKNESEKAIKQIIFEANRMNKIIVDMLEVSKLESISEVKKEDVNIKDIVLETISSYQLEIDSKQIKMKTKLASKVVSMNIDHARWLVSNLLSNAIKYNKDKGSIEIVLNDNLLSIKDTGIGIKEEDLSRIYERFYRVDKQLSKDKMGTGLGLSIVKHICNNYGFDIKTESEINEYTKITIIF